MLMALTYVCHAEDILQVVPFKTTAGVKYGNNKTIEISLTNESFDVANLQFDILLPEGMALSSNNSSFTERAQVYDEDEEGYIDNFTWTQGVVSSGYTRIVFTPTTGNVIKSGSGTILRIRYKTDASMEPGIYPILMEGIELDKTVMESLTDLKAVSYVVIGDSNPISSESEINLSSLTGDLPSFVVEKLNADIASNTSLRKLNLSGVTSLGADLVVPENAVWYTSKAARLNRTFSSSVKCTVCLPFGIPASTASALGTFYQFSGIEAGKVVMEAVTGDLAANTPYIFSPADGQTGIGANSASGLTVSFGTSPVTENATAKFTFKGTYEPITWTEAPTGIYGFSVAEADGGVSGVDAGEFVLCGAGANIPAYRAYLEYTGEGTLSGTRGAGLPARMPIIWRSGAESHITGIETVGQAAAEAGTAWYGLNGQQYAGKPTAKGIYVHNGKKVIVK